MTVLIVAEHDNTALSPATLATVTAAKQLSEKGAGEVHILVAGSNAKSAAEMAAKIPGIAKVRLADAVQFASPLAEDVAALVVALAKDYSHVLTPATTYGKNLLPRASALMDSQQISDAIAIVSADTFIRPTYAGNALATVQSKDAIKFVTVRGTAFEKAAPAANTEGASAAIEAVEAPATTSLATHKGAEISKSERPELTAAKIIVSGGRGMQSGENFVMIEEIADKLGAAVGASRAAVDAGFKPNDFQVGQTGKIVAPELYIAVGISGAIQHLAGMKDSKVIVAINKDEEAPMFQIADYGIVGDLFKVLPELSAELDKIKK